MKNNEIVERPLLMDRIQLSCSIPYIISIDKNKRDIIENRNELSYYQSVLSEYLKDKKEFGVYYDRAKKQYYIEVPESDYKKEFPYISHVRLRLDNPYTITIEFNFIRFLKYTIEPNIAYNKDYDLSIRVADDNYIDDKIWSGWDSSLVKNIALQIPDICKCFSDRIIELYIEDFSRKYNILTVKQIEFNKDYNVGHHRSADVLHEIMKFIISSSGTEWINDLSGHAISVYKAKEKDITNRQFYGDHYNPTLKFFMAKGFFCKIYRKTTDHIRFELTIQKQFIKNKFKKQGFESVNDGLRKIAKHFFKKSDFIGKIKESIDHSYSDHFSIVDNVYDFLDKTYPELSYITDCVSHLNPIIDPDVIRFINSNERLRPYFERKYLKNGKKILIYSKFKKEVMKKHNIEYDLDKRKFKEDLWKEYKKTFPEDKIYVKNELNGFIHKGN